MHSYKKEINRSTQNYTSPGAVDLKPRREASICYSRSLNSKSNFHAEKKQEGKFFDFGVNKLSRMKFLYSMQNKLNKNPLSKKPFSQFNPKINSFSEEAKNKSFSNTKDRFTNNFQKKQAFHYPGIRSDYSERNLFVKKETSDIDCMGNEKEHLLPQFPNQEKNSQLYYQALPLENESHFLDRVKSMKRFPQTPPLVQKTKRNKQRGQNTNFSLSQFLSSYNFHLQIFQNIDFTTFQKISSSNKQYFGEIAGEEHQEHGKGVILYENGKIFEGHFQFGYKEGLGYEEYPDNSFYLGNFVQGQREGRGKFQWKNGEIYDGEWKSNKKSGSGIWKGPNNLSYVGEWQNDAIEGFGVLVEKGSRYEGEFKNYMKEGSGTIRFENGEVYTGNFKHNLPSGVGDYFWNNKDHYHGEFTNGKRHGLGVIKYSNGGYYEGNFNNDKKSGYGHQSYEDNLFYQGYFQNDLRHGLGILFSQKKHIFQGYWLNNSAVNPEQCRKKNHFIIKKFQRNKLLDEKKVTLETYGERQVQKGKIRFLKQVDMSQEKRRSPMMQRNSKELVIAKGTDVVAFKF